MAVWPNTGETVTDCFLEQRSAASVSFQKQMWQVMLSVFTFHMAKYSSVSSSLLSRGGFSCSDHTYLRAGNVVGLLPTLRPT